MSEEVRPVDPTELVDVTEAWERVPDDEVYLRGVTVASGEGLGEPFDWLVTIWAREYFRDDPLGQELQEKLESAMLAVPGVNSAENASWERGTSPGGPQVRLCAKRARTSSMN
jgi:hypothetical protein